MQAKKRKFGGHGYAIGRKVEPHLRVCQRCARQFKTDRIVPYCFKCFNEKRKERRF